MPNEKQSHEKRVTRTVSGEAIVHKKSSLAKIRDVFIAEDADKVGNYVVMDILVPSIKKAIVDIIKSSADMIFGTKSTSQNNQTRYVYGSSIAHVSYGQSFQNQKKTAEYQDDKPSQWDFSYIEFKTKEKADIVADEMCNLISVYGKAYVADLCDIIDEPCEFTANYYGWKDLHDLVPIKIPGTTHYYLRFPKAIPLERD